MQIMPSTQRIPLRAVALATIATLATLATLGIASEARAADPPLPADARFDALQRQVTEQSARLDALRRSMAREEASLNEVKRALDLEVLAARRARGVNVDTTVAQASPPHEPVAPRPVGQAPETDGRAPTVASIFDQPGVLTPKAKAVLDPSLQHSYSSSNRIALVGYTVIPAILIGVIDVREVKRHTVNATLTGRYGLTNRFEMEARLPFVYRSDTAIGREILQGTATNNASNATGNGNGISICRRSSCAAELVPMMAVSCGGIWARAASHGRAHGRASTRSS